MSLFLCPCCPSPTCWLCLLFSSSFFFSQSGPYPWAIVSDPLRAFLFILVRDPDKFSGSKTEKVVLAKCKKLGFTSSWNSPRKTVQEGCSYTPEPDDVSTAVVAEDSTAEEGADAAAAEKPALSSLLGLRGGAFGIGGPLHASCKVRGNSLRKRWNDHATSLLSLATSLEAKIWDEDQARPVQHTVLGGRRTRRVFFFAPRPLFLLPSFFPMWSLSSISRR